MVSSGLHQLRGHASAMGENLAERVAVKRQFMRHFWRRVAQP